MNNQALFTILLSGELRPAKDGELANVKGCYFAGASFQCGIRPISGWIEFPHPTKKELDIHGDVIYERSVMESLSFYVEDCFTNEMWDLIIEFASEKKYFSMKWEYLDRWIKISQ